jgi:hypothetical protein
MWAPELDVQATFVFLTCPVNVAHIGSPILTVDFESNKMGLSLVETGFFEQEKIKKERVGIKNNRDLIFFIYS